jgi:hypothetical protein
MMSYFLVAIGDGIRRAWRLWLILPLYLVGLALGLVQAWPLLAVGGPNGLRNPFLSELMSDGSDALLDLFLGSPAAPTQTLAWAGSALLLTQLFGLAYTFFSGGMLSAAAGKHSFWAGCWRFFWSFLGLGALLVLLAGLAALIAGLGGSALGSPTAGLLAGLLLLQLLNVVGEYARAIAVARHRRNPFALLGAALSFCQRHAGGVLALALLGLLLHAGVIALYLGLATFPLGLGALLAQQLIVLLWLWVKLLRLSWALSYVSAVDAGALNTHMPDGMSPSGMANLV